MFVNLDDCLIPVNKINDSSDTVLNLRHSSGIATESTIKSQKANLGAPRIRIGSWGVSHSNT